jgi:hypothetical protein
MAMATITTRTRRGTTTFAASGLALVLVLLEGGGHPLEAGPPHKGDQASTGAALSAPASPTVLAAASDQQFLGDVAVVDGQVLFTAGRVVPRSQDTPGPPSETLGVVRRVPVNGGPVDELWSGGGGGSDVAAGGDGIYFVTYDFFWRTGTLQRLPAAGGAPVQLGSWESHGSSQSLAVAADVAYWTHSAGAGSFVLRTQGSDGTTVTLADSSTIGSSADDVLVKDGFVYWFSSAASPTVFGVAAAGGTPFALYQAPQIAALAAAPSDPTLYTAAGANLIAMELKNELKNESKVETRALVTGVDPHDAIGAVGAGAGWIYFGTWNAQTGSGALSKVARHGGAITVIAAGAVHPVAIAVDATSVYWADTQSLTVSKAPL